MKAKLRIPAWPVLFATTVMSAIGAKIDGWDSSPDTQYHVQTDEGAERFFRYQTLSGQYRKEKRLQDGTVVGSYGWVDADGYLRLNDYVADDRGYRVLRAKRLFVGGQTPSPATAATDAAAYRPYGYPPDQSKYLLFPSSSPSPLPPVEVRRRPTPPAGYYPTSTPPSVRPASASASARPESAAVAITPRDHHVPAAAPAKYRYSAYETPSYTRPESGRNSAQPYDRHRQPTYAYPTAHRKSYGDDVDEAPNYEAVAVTTGNNGFRYYLPRQYHEERQSSGAADERVGSFGYVDPFGIRRVVYYKASPGAGFAHRKSNRYVGLDGPPFDPTPPPPTPTPTTWPHHSSDHSSLAPYPL